MNQESPLTGASHDDRDYTTLGAALASVFDGKLPLKMMKARSTPKP